MHKINIFSLAGMLTFWKSKLANPNDFKNCKKSILPFPVFEVEIVSPRLHRGLQKHDRVAVCHPPEGELA